jgi:hypothetical protein
MNNEDILVVKQTGFIDRGLRPSDFKTGALAFVERITNGDWRPYYPTVEKQYGIGFDTMSCTTFSAMNCIEMQLNWMIKNNKIPADNLKGLTDLGFIDENGFFNASDRFIAIMSGTTEMGNDFQSVWDCIRKNGILPEKDFPFGGTTFSEYHDKTKITQQMMDKAKESLKYLVFAYEFVTFDQDPVFSAEQQNLCRQALKHTPLHIAIPVPGTHAITLGCMDENSVYTFDQYPPYLFTAQIQYPVHYALKGLVNPVQVNTAPPTTRTLKLGMTGDDVQKLQENLKKLGFFKLPITTKYFGLVTRACVMAFQKSVGLVQDGVVGPLTQDKIIKAIPQKKTLVEALIQVESNGNDNAIGDKDLIDKAYGCLQIRKPVCTDVNKAFGTSYKAQDMLGNRELSIVVFYKYISLYATPGALGRPVTDQDRARIWNGGPTGYKKTATLKYWEKAKKLL